MRWRSEEMTLIGWGFKMHTRTSLHSHTSNSLTHRKVDCRATHRLLQPPHLHGVIYLGVFRPIKILSRETRYPDCHHPSRVKSCDDVSEIFCLREEKAVFCTGFLFQLMIVMKQRIVITVKNGLSHAVSSLIKDTQTTSETQWSCFEFFWNGQWKKGL